MAVLLWMLGCTVASLTVLHVHGADDTDPLAVVVQQLSQQVTSLQARLTQQDAKMADMDALLQQQDSTISSLQASVSALNNQMDLQTPFAAFEVQFSDDPHHGVANHDIFQFDSVEFNVGNGYSPQNGMFQAPVAGIYLFQVKVTPYPNGHMYVYLVNEGRNIDSANIYDDTHEETGDSTRIVQLAQGDRVWLAKNDGVTSVRGWAHTKLSGYLLRAV